MPANRWNTIVELSLWDLKSDTTDKVFGNLLTDSRWVLFAPNLSWPQCCRQWWGVRIEGWGIWDTREQRPCYLAIRKMLSQCTPYLCGFCKLLLLSSISQEGSAGLGSMGWIFLEILRKQEMHWSCFFSKELQTDCPKGRGTTEAFPEAHALCLLLPSWSPLGISSGPKAAEPQLTQNGSSSGTRQC